MCVYYELCKPAIKCNEKYVNAIVLHNLLQKDEIYKFHYRRKIQEAILETIFLIQREMSPCLIEIRDNQDVAIFINKLNKSVNELKKMKWSYRFAFSNVKKEAIWQKEKEICRKLIIRSFLHYEYTDDKLVKRELELKRPVAFLENYVASVSNGLNSFQVILKNSIKLETSHSNFKKLLDSENEYLNKSLSYLKMLEKCKPYQGFDIISTGKLRIAIHDNSDCEIFEQEISMICLLRKNENFIYPYNWMFVCIDLKLESGGATENEAYEDLQESLDLFFYSLFSDSDIHSNIQALKDEITNQTIWKNTFHELVRLGKKKPNVEDKVYLYTYKLNFGV